MKKGFTLAEILITLTIVGVVAALTMPALTTSVSQAKIGPSLAKFVNTWENGARHYLYDADAPSLTAASQAAINPDTKKPQASFMMGSTLDALGKYIIWATPEQATFDEYAKSVTTGDGKNLPNLYSGVYVDENVRLLKDGGLLAMRDLGIGQSYGTDNYTNTAGTSYKKPLAFMIYDINGFKAPNSMGKDIFGFILDESGALISVGSLSYNKLFNTKVKCEPKGSYTSAIGCTGAIADNGWKADY